MGSLTEFIINYEPPYRLQEVIRAEALGGIPWPSDKAAPKPRSLGKRKPSDRLPKADVVVVTWTVAEGFALGDVLTPGFRDVRSPKKKPADVTPWYAYRPSNFASYRKNLRGPAPAIKANRLGSFFMTRIHNEPAGKPVRVLCFKSELHLNRDWISLKKEKKYLTVPVADLFAQIIQETNARMIITVGTAGATYGKTGLGDVMLTRAAKFRLSKAFLRAPYNKTTFRSSFTAPAARYLNAAGPMLKAYKSQLDPTIVTRTPKLWAEWRKGDLPRFSPMLTTDGFEFGTSKGKNANYLQNQGCGVEMGDAVLGMVVEHIKDPSLPVPWRLPFVTATAMPRVPKWLVVRNASDPQIDGNLPKDKQIKEAVFYYKKYGYWTSVNSAFAVWAVVRGAAL
jgi:hypothetical protein